MDEKIKKALKKAKELKKKEPKLKQEEIKKEFKHEIEEMNKLLFKKVKKR